MKYLSRFLAIALTVSIQIGCKKTVSISDPVAATIGNNTGTTVYIGAATGDTYAIDAATGTQKWMFPSDQEGQTPFSVINYANGTVYICNQYTLHAVNAQTGIEKWSFNSHTWLTVPGYDYIPPVIAGGMVYISGVGYLFALDTANGQVKWSHSSFGSSSIVIVNNTLYDWGGTGAAYDATTGIQQSSVKLQLPDYPSQGHYSAATVANNTLYLGYATNNYTGSILAFDLTTGAQKWSYPCGQQWFRYTPVIHRSTLYIAGDYGGLYALDTANGHLQWKTPQVFTTDTINIYPTENVCMYGEYASLTCSGNSVFMGANSFDASTGTRRWSFASGFGMPVVANNTVFVAGINFELYALDIGNGAQRWKFTPTSSSIVYRSIPESVLSAYGKPCVVTADGTVY